MQLALTVVLVIILFLPIYLILRHSITARMRRRQDPAAIKHRITELEDVIRYKKSVLDGMDKQVALTRKEVGLTQEIAVTEMELARLRKKLADVQAAKLDS